VLLIDKSTRPDIEFPNDLLARLAGPNGVLLYETRETWRAKNRPVIA